MRSADASAGRWGSMQKEAESDEATACATPASNLEGCSLEVPCAMEHYSEPHVVCELAAKVGVVAGKPEKPITTPPSCALNDHNATSSIRQRHKDSASLVAEALTQLQQFQGGGGGEGAVGYQYFAEYTNPYANARSGWRRSGGPSGYSHTTHVASFNQRQLELEQRRDADTIFPDEEVKKEVKSGNEDEVRLVDSKDKLVDRRSIRYWEGKGLPTEGILLNKKMLLCLLTPDKVLWKYFTKVQGSLHPDLDMEPGMRRNMSTLYHKVFERELSPVDGKVSMKFGRAFVAQELKGKKFNWAQYALSEHIRISERNSKKSQRKKYSRQLAESDDQEDDDDMNYVLDDEEDDVKSRRQQQHGSRRSVAQLDPDDSELQDCHEQEFRCCHLLLPHASAPPPERQQSSMQDALDVDLQALRADLKRRLMQTHVMHDTLREFDTHVLTYVSDKARLEQHKEDLNLALSLIEHKCKLLESSIYFVVGRIEMEKGCLQESNTKLLELIAMRPNDPQRDYPPWKRWCTDLQQHYKHLGYAKHELGEQEYALKKLQVEYDGAQADRRSLLKQLVRVDDRSPQEESSKNLTMPTRASTKRLDRDDDDVRVTRRGSN